MRPASANASADASDLGSRLLPIAEDGAGSAVRIDFFDDPPIEDRGVSASFLRMFTGQMEKHLGVTSCGWWSDRHATTTRQVVQNVIKPKTCVQTCDGERQCRYVRLMRGQTDEASRSYFGKAFAFVSHSWGSEWSELVDAICLHSDRWVAQWVRAHPNEKSPVTPPYYWIDIFAINQHPGTGEYKKDMPDWDNMAPDLPSST